MESGTCVCKTNEGFREDTSLSPPECQECLKGCKSCPDDVNTCAGECRENYSGPDCTCPTAYGLLEDTVNKPNSCTCQIDNGYRINTSTIPHTCEPCEKGCVSCTDDKTVCDGGLCRANFSGGDCSCPSDGFSGFRLDTTTAPYTCEACKVKHCLNCSESKEKCEENGCKTNFLLDSNVCSCPTDGFRLNTTAVPQICEACSVTHCSNCISDKDVCETDGCRANFVLDSNACNCS